MTATTETKFAGRVTPKDGTPRTLYEHQINAISALDKLDQKDTFRSILVLPTGGGKTLTAVYWLLKNAVDRGKKVLWIAHRQMLLDQAASTFINNAYTKTMINHTTFSFRIISGDHDRPVNIRKDDNVLICSKDSLISGLNYLDEWLDGEEIYFIIDEAHHAVARSYRKIIDYVFEKAKSVKMLGLTATPERTNEDEKGALAKIFGDGIVYGIGLNELTKKGIVSNIIPENSPTGELVTTKLGVKDRRDIQNRDQLPKEIAEFLVNNKKRNRFIVEKYIENKDKYGQTLVFAINIDHAIALSTLFNEHGIKADFIISSVKDKNTGVIISDKQNKEKIEKYKNGELQVLINVNILTEGTDLPQTHTVFLTRPTTSRVLMTQMVGRALRGVKAGGTKDAYIVSFVDDWEDKIVWESPDSLISEEWLPNDKDYHTRNKMSWISISLIENFARMADENVDTSEFEKIPSIKRIPLGMYIFETFQGTYSILVYDSNKEMYENLIKDLPNIFEDFGVDTEELPDDKLTEMIKYCRDYYFSNNTFPPFSEKDMGLLLEFYAEKEIEPTFIPLSEIERKSVHPADIAKHIIDEDMRRSEQNEYLQKMWDENQNLKIYYNQFMFFKKQVQIELDRCEGYIRTEDNSEYNPNVTYTNRELEKFTVQELKEIAPDYINPIIESVYAAAKNSDGEYVCAMCGQTFKARRYLQIDHIKPMSKGGLTVRDNLQILCRHCNGKKGDKE